MRAYVREVSCDMTHTHTHTSAHLHGDKVVRLTLDGAFHSINNAGQTTPCDQWYGAEGVVDEWLPEVVEKIRFQEGSNVSQ